MRITSRQVIHGNCIALAIQSTSRLDRASTLTVYQIELRVAIESERQRKQSLQRSADDIRERACIREYTSPADCYDEERCFYALSEFERESVDELIREATVLHWNEQKLRARLRRVESLLRTMNMRRVA
jgi:hypothetical protein